jgi:hypothetical protein
VNAALFHAFQNASHWNAALLCQIMFFKMQAIVCTVEKAKSPLGSI